MADDQVSRPAEEFFLRREIAERVMRRVGYTDDVITQVLADITFPAESSTVVRHAAKFGISKESLTERLGGSP